jgi:hypothetical protein
VKKIVIIVKYRQIVRPYRTRRELENVSRIETGQVT